MNYREAVLVGAKAAKDLHLKLGTQERLSRDMASVDVYSIILALGSVLLFRPLDRILGAYLKSGDKNGVLVTSERPARIQRFTAAHELGHMLLMHSNVVDGEEILTRNPRTMKDSSEISADAFASELLAPKWLIANYARMMGLTRGSLNPGNVYQLSLRIGLSYEAMCWTLERNNYIDHPLLESLLAVSPKSIKSDIIGEDSDVMETWRPDIWRITSNDFGSLCEVSPDDILIFELDEPATSGYTWEWENSGSHALIPLSDRRISLDGNDEVGSPLMRRLLKKAAMNPKDSNVRASLRRQWDPADTKKLFQMTLKPIRRELGIPSSLRALGATS